MSQRNGGEPSPRDPFLIRGRLTFAIPSAFTIHLLRNNAKSTCLRVGVLHTQKHYTHSEQQQCCPYYG